MPIENSVKVATPYGLPALVEASAKLASEHIISDVTELVRQLAWREDYFGQPDGWAKLLTHTGWVDPAGRIGLLDFSYEFPSVDSLEDMRLRLLVWRIEGGNGEPLAPGDKAVTMTFSIRKGGWGELSCTHAASIGTVWYEWLEVARERFKTYWDEALARGQLAGLTNAMTRDRDMRKVLEQFWQTSILGDIAGNLGCDLVVIDDEDEATRYASNLEWQACHVHLVSSWLAAELEKHGALATIRMGLPLWSRDNHDAPHLENVMQDIAYEKFGHSLKTELASTPKE